MTHAMILAAGRGERMRPLTDDTPKPLLMVRGKRLIEWHLQALARAGVQRVVINTAWLEEQFPAVLGNGSRWGLQIAYSMEGRDHGGALETAGGMKKALPLLDLHDNEAFWYVAADVFAPDFDFAAGQAEPLNASADWARLFMVANPAQHPGGDFGIAHGRLCVGAADARLTWSGIGLFRPAFVERTMAALAVGEKARLRPCLDAAIAAARVSAQRYDGLWADIGTPERLQAMQR